MICLLWISFHSNLSRINLCVYNNGLKLYFRRDTNKFMLYCIYSYRDHMKRKGYSVYITIQCWDIYRLFHFIQTINLCYFNKYPVCLSITKLWCTDIIKFTDAKFDIMILQKGGRAFFINYYTKYSDEIIRNVFGFR